MEALQIVGRSLFEDRLSVAPVGNTECDRRIADEAIVTLADAQCEDD